MSGETKGSVSGWTIDTLASLQAALRAADEKFDEERDRRLTEVAIEREKALKIKETADLAALQLAREIQTYKDEKANELREQINSERGLYATKGDLTAVTEKIEATLAPLADYVARNQGKGSGYASAWSIGLGALGAVGIIAALLSRIL